jgi:IS4 transposase
MEISGSKMRRLFRHRRKIETGFREMKRLRIKTTTKDPLMGVFFYAIACIMYNIWIRIRLTLRQKFQLNELKTLFIDNIIGYAKAFGLRLKILGLRK